MLANCINCSFACKIIETAGNLLIILIENIVVVAINTFFKNDSTYTSKHSEKIRIIWRKTSNLGNFRKYTYIATCSINIEA